MNILSEKSFDLINRYSLLIICILSAILLGIWLYIRVFFLTWGWPNIEGIENNVVYSIQRILGGVPLYVDPELPPYAITQYTPLYHYTISGFGFLFGVSPDNVPDMFLLSRMGSLIFNILFAAVVFFTSRRIFCARPQAAFIVAVFAFIGLSATAYSRPDSLYLLFAFVAVFFFFRHIAHPQHRSSLWLSLGFAALALFTKQSGMIIIAAFLAHTTIIRPSWRGFLRNGTAYTFFLLVLFLGFKGTDTRNFLLNTIDGLKNGIDFPYFWKRIVAGYFHREGLLWVPVGLFCGLFLLLKGKDELSRTTGLFTLVFFVFGLGTSLKTGSNASYFAEFMTLTLWGVLLVARQTRLHSKLPEIRMFVLLVFLVFAGFKVSYSYFFEITSGRYNMSTTFLDQEKAVSDFLLHDQKLQSNDMVLILLSTDKTFMHNLLWRNCVMPNRDIVDCCSDPLKVFDYTNFVENISNCKIKYLVNYGGKTNRPYLGADFSHFSLLKQIGPYTVYRCTNKL